MSELDQLLRTLAQTWDDLQRAQYYIAQLGDLTQFITDTVRNAWTDVPKIIEAFGKVGIR